MVCGCATLSTAPQPVVEFRLGDMNPGPGLSEMNAPGASQKVYLNGVAVLTNPDIAFARVTTSSDRLAVEITFTKAGAKKFADITAANLNKPLGILVDGKLVSAPIIRDTIAGGKAIITGNFAADEAKRIAAGFPKR
jgi:preprotein translocase subunit SecD